MRTVITISLNGNAYQLEATGYEALRAYLQVAEQRLADNPDQMEILADLEQAIADKCGRYLGPHKNVVSAEEISVVLQEMGPVDGGASESVVGGVPGASGVRRQGYGAGAFDGENVTGGGGAPDREAVGGSAANGSVGAATGQSESGSGIGTTGGGSGDAYGGATYRASAAGGDATGAAAWAGKGSGDSAGSASYGAGDAVPPGAPGGADASGAGAGATANAGGSGAAFGSAYSSAGSNTNASGEPPKRLYQIREGAVISGVCKGLAAYLNMDVSIVRLIFVLLTFLTGGVWILVYLVMMFVIPYAETSEQHAAAHGWPFNAEELVARAKAHYAQFRDNETLRRKQWREQRRMWRFQRKQWKEQRRDWERWGSAYGEPPPPPPWWNGQQPTSTTYASQMLNGVLSPVAELLRAVLFITFLILLVSLITRHRIFGWWLPHDIPLWLGVVILVVLYRVIATPLNQARYVAYYGGPFAHGWVALWGVLVWLALVIFLSWLAWQHWAEIQAFFQQIVQGWRQLMEHGPAQTVEHAALLFAARVPRPSYADAFAAENSRRMDKSTARTCLVRLPTEM